MTRYSLEKLIDQLYNEKDINIRRYVPDKLAKLGDWSSTKHLAKVMLDTKERIILRNECAESLGKQGDPEAIEFLIQILEDPNDELRRTGIWSLGQIGISETLAHVVKLRNDPSIQVRKYVAKSLGRIRHQNVIKELISFFKEIYPEDDMILIDVIRSVTVQINNCTNAEVKFWLDKSYRILESSSSQKLKHAVSILLNAIFRSGIHPDGDFLIKFLESLNNSEVLIRTQVIRGLGYAKQIQYLRKMTGSVQAKIALGIAEDCDYLVDLLHDTSKIEMMEGILKGLVLCNGKFDHYQYICHPDLNVTLTALEYHAKNLLPVSTIIKAYENELGKNKILSIMKYYGNKPVIFRILEHEVFDGDKSSRQSALSAITSGEFISGLKDSDKLVNILQKIADQDPIWHIRRDAKIGITNIRSQ